jgi:hypothetical protein
MNAFFAIVRREIRERSQILAAAAVASLIPIVLPALRRLSADAQGWASLLIAFVFALAIAASLGFASLVPRIVNRRVAFDLARPVSAAAIWIGSVAAATLLAVAAAAIVWIPAALSGAAVPWKELVVDRPSWHLSVLLFLLALIALFCVCHALGVAVRSHSALIALDVAFAATAAFAFAAVLGKLPSFLASGPRASLCWGFAFAAAAAFFAAGLASIAHGRTDIRSAHRTLARVLWPGVALAIAAGAVYASWVMAAGPRDLDRKTGFWVSAAQTGSWVEVGGHARGAYARFVYDVATGRYARTETRDWRGPAISRNGRLAAWVDGRPEGDAYEVRTASLDATDANPVRRTRLFLSSFPSLFVLSPDGSRLATADDGVLSVHDPATGRTLVSARVGEKGDELRGFFVGEERFRIYVQPVPLAQAQRVRIYELDVRSKRLEQTGQLESPAGGVYFVADRSGNRLATVAARGKDVVLRDARTGTELAGLRSDAGVTSRSPGFLSDGRVILAERSETSSRLAVFRPDGSLDRVVPLPAPGHVQLGGEIMPARLVVGVGVGGPVRYASYLVDLDSGSVRKLGDRLWPAARLSSLADIDASPQPGSDGTKLFTRGGSELVRLDPSTGKFAVILGGP